MCASQVKPAVERTCQGKNGRLRTCIGLPRGRIQGMSPAKEQLIRLIQDQPDDSSYEEILRELAFAAMVERGIADSDAGKSISNEEMARRIESWRK